MSQPESKEKPANKRKHQRIHTRIEIPYWKYVKFKRDGDVNIGFVKNMSRGGFFIETDMVYPKGMEVGFEFYLPSSAHPVTGMAQVMWARKPDDVQDDPTVVPGMGLEFKKFEEGSQAILMGFIEGEMAK